jgi:hypothetical protein
VRARARARARGVGCGVWCKRKLAEARHDTQGLAVLELLSFDVPLLYSLVIGGFQRGVGRAAAVHAAVCGYVICVRAQCPDPLSRFEDCSSKWHRMPAVGQPLANIGQYPMPAVGQYRRGPIPANTSVVGLYQPRPA